MALTDFLSNGQIPAGSAATSTTSQTVLPDWYTNYAMQVLSNQQAASATPYQTFGGPRVAEFSPTQQQAFGLTGQAAGAYQPALQTATAATQGLMGQTAAGAAQPYFAQATQIDPAAIARGDYSSARDLAKSAAQTDIVGAASPYLRQAAGMSGAAVAQPMLQQGAQMTQQSTQALGQQAAQPYFGAAGALSGVSAAAPGLQYALNTAEQGMQALGQQAAQPYMQSAARNATDVSAYMNPYQESVVNRIAELGARNLQENILPGVEGRYIAAGQLGYGGREGAAGTPSGMLTDTARALRDINADILAKQSEALQAGYGQAQSAAQADLARQAQLASTAGQLGTAQQNALLQAAQQQAAVGAQLGQLTQAQQSALTNLGAQAGQLGTAQQQALAQAGQQLGALGQIGGSLTNQQQQALANIGAQFGSLAGQQQQGALTAAGQLANLGTAGAGLAQNQQTLLANIGQQAGALGGADITRGLAGAEQLAGLGAQAQQLGLTGAGALSNVGAQQQGQAQKNIDLAYADFLRQQGYPQEQINNMVQTLGGVKGAVPTATATEGIVPLGYQPDYKPSTAETIAGALSGIGGILSKAGVI